MCQNHITEFRILTWKSLQDALLHRSQCYLKSIPRGFSQNLHFNFLFPARTYSQPYIATAKPHKVIWTKKLEGSLPSIFRTTTLLPVSPGEQSGHDHPVLYFSSLRLHAFFGKACQTALPRLILNTEPPWLPEIAPSLICLNRVRFHPPKNIPCAAD